MLPIDSIEMFKYFFKVHNTKIINFIVFVVKLGSVSKR